MPKDMLVLRGKKPVRDFKNINSKGGDWTSRNAPFILLYTEKFTNRKEALKREKYLKTFAGRNYIKQKLNNRSFKIHSPVAQLVEQAAVGES